MRQSLMRAVCVVVLQFGLIITDIQLLSVPHAGPLTRTHNFDVLFRTVLKVGQIAPCDRSHHHAPCVHLRFTHAFWRWREVRLAGMEAAVVSARPMAALKLLHCTSLLQHHRARARSGSRFHSSPLRNAVPYPLRRCHCCAAFTAASASRCDFCFGGHTHYRSP